MCSFVLFGGKNKKQFPRKLTDILIKKLWSFQKIDFRIKSILIGRYRKIRILEKILNFLKYPLIRIDFKWNFSIPGRSFCTFLKTLKFQAKRSDFLGNSSFSIFFESSACPRGVPQTSCCQSFFNQRPKIREFGFIPPGSCGCYGPWDSLNPIECR